MTITWQELEARAAAATATIDASPDPDSAAERAALVDDLALYDRAVPPHRRARVVVEKLERLAARV